MGATLTYLAYFLTQSSNQNSLKDNVKSKSDISTNPFNYLPQTPTNERNTLTKHLITKQSRVSSINFEKKPNIGGGSAVKESEHELFKKNTYGGQES
jgi:hypothetical protein